MANPPPMHTVRIKKGHRFSIAGRPSLKISNLPDPERVALLPAKIAHIKPRLTVAKGDRVRIGSPLVEDKRNPAIKFLSPGGGVVGDIHYGPRRILEAIIIHRDTENELRTDFPSIPSKALESMNREQLVDHILAGGLWWVFQELPFRDLPDPQTRPPQIIVGLSSKEPFQPQASVYLNGHNDLLAYGLKALQKLTPGPVLVFGNSDDRNLIQQYGQWITHGVHGHYPADDPGTLNFRLKHSAAENRAWIINGQDLLLLARLLAQGRQPIERVIAVGGSDTPVRQHYRSRIGVPLSCLVSPAAVPTTARWVVGGLMRGYCSEADKYLGLRETSLTILPDGNQARFLALFNPGFTTPTHSRIFLSKLNRKPLLYDCNLNGEERACIACMHCTDVCPVDILPQMTYKAILAEEVEEYLEHGLLDCVECGLCSYVCPSKIELAQTFKAAKAAYAKEKTGTPEK